MLFVCRGIILLRRKQESISTRLRMMVVGSVYLVNRFLLLTRRMSSRVTVPAQLAARRSNASLTTSWRRFGMFPLVVVSRTGHNR